MTPADISGNSNRFGPAMIGYIYNELDLDVVTNGTQGMDTNEIMSRLFNDVPSDSEAYAMFGHENHLLEYPEKGYEGIYNMLMNYDGRAFVDGKPLTSFDQLQVGDAILVVQRNAGITITMIYQGKISGNHRFLAGIYSPTGALNYMYFAKTYKFADIDAFNAFVYGHVPTRDGTGETEYYWEGYLVLRPSRAYADINDRVRVVRDLSASALSSVEKDLLASITPEDLIGTTGATNLNGFAQAVYSQAYILIDQYVNKTVVKARQDFMGKDGLYDPAVKPEAAQWLPMIVENSWGGTMLEDTSKRMLSLEVTDFQIGDILCIRNDADTNNYIVGIYQGKGNFLTYDSAASPVFCVYTFDEICAINNGVWEFFYVLRPSQLANAN